MECDFHCSSPSWDFLYCCAHSLVRKIFGLEKNFPEVMPKRRESSSTWKRGTPVSLVSSLLQQRGLSAYPPSLSYDWMLACSGVRDCSGNAPHRGSSGSSAQQCAGEGSSDGSLVGTLLCFPVALPSPPSPAPAPTESRSVGMPSAV